MATLRYKNPKTNKWELLNAGGGTDTPPSSTDQVVFGTISTFPPIGDLNKIYVDTTTQLIYVYNSLLGYTPAGDGSGVDMGQI